MENGAAVKTGAVLNQLRSLRPNAASADTPNVCGEKLIPFDPRVIDGSLAGWTGENRMALPRGNDRQVFSALARVLAAGSEVPDGPCTQPSATLLPPQALRKAPSGSGEPQCRLGVRVVLFLGPAPPGQQRGACASAQDGQRSRLRYGGPTTAAARCGGAEQRANDRQPAEPAGAAAARVGWGRAHRADGHHGNECPSNILHDPTPLIVQPSYLQGVGQTRNLLIPTRCGYLIATYFHPGRKVNRHHYRSATPQPCTASQTSLASGFCDIPYDNIRGRSGEPNILIITLKESVRARSPHTTGQVGVLIAAAVLAYWPAIGALWAYWTDEPSLGGHGILVAALAGWLLFRARDRTDSEPVKPTPWALLLLVPCSVATLIFWKAGLQALQLLMLPAVIWLAVLAAFGTGVARSVAIPVGYLYFAMPAWNILSVPLQELTVHVVTVVAPLVGLPASVSGTSVAFPNGARFVVTLACSGVGFLTQGLAVAVLLGELEEARFPRRVGLIVSMTLVALVTNWVRVILLLAIGYSSGMDNVIVSRRHLEFGYVLFVVVLLAFVWVTTRRALPEPEPRARRLAVPVFSGYFPALTALVAAPLLVSFLSRPADADSIPRVLRMPAGQHPWQGPLPAVNADWRPVFLGAHFEQHVAYEDVAGHKIEAVAVGYAVQQQGRELVNEGNSLLGQGGLSALTAAFIEVGASTYREDVAVDAEGNRSVIWSYYDIEGKSFVVPILSQLWYGVRALTGRPDSELFAFRAACVPSCAQARDVLESFLHGMKPGLRSAVWPAGRDSKNGTRVMNFKNDLSGSREASAQRTLLPRSPEGRSAGMQS